MDLQPPPISHHIVFQRSPPPPDGAVRPPDQRQRSCPGPHLPRCLAQSREGRHRPFAQKCIRGSESLLTKNSKNVPRKSEQYEKIPLLSNHPQLPQFFQILLRMGAKKFFLVFGFFSGMHADSENVGFSLEPIFPTPLSGPVAPRPGSRSPGCATHYHTAGS